MRDKARELGLNVARGMLMGGADIIPGVSGGTVALVVGIYERLISSVRAAAAIPLSAARGGRESARERFHEVEWQLVLPLAFGILVAIGIGAVVIPPLLEAYPEEMSAAFLGLVAASLVVPWRRISHRGAVAVGTMLAAAALAFVLVGLPPTSIDDPSVARVSASAAVAICAMILPGVSGAFLLKVLGIYDQTLAALTGFDVVYVAAFVAGAILGLGLFAKLLEALLARRHDLTMAALTGLMVGALRALWPWLDDDRGLLAPPGDASALAPAVISVLAFVVLSLLLRAGRRRERAAA